MTISLLLGIIKVCLQLFSTQIMHRYAIAAQIKQKLYTLHLN